MSHCPVCQADEAAWRAREQKLESVRPSVEWDNATWNDALDAFIAAVKSDPSYHSSIVGPLEEKVASLKRGQS